MEEEGKEVSHLEGMAAHREAASRAVVSQRTEAALEGNQEEGAC